LLQCGSRQIRSNSPDGLDEKSRSQIRALGELVVAVVFRSLAFECLTERVDRLFCIEWLNSWTVSGPDDHPSAARTVLGDVVVEQGLATNQRLIPFGGVLFSLHPGFHRLRLQQHDDDLAWMAGGVEAVGLCGVAALIGRDAAVLLVASLRWILEPWDVLRASCQT